MTRQTDATLDFFTDPPPHNGLEDQRASTSSHPIPSHQTMIQTATPAVRSNTPKKVAFLGNMNNNCFTLARLLRDRGIDTDVLIFSNEPSHFHPAYDSFAGDDLSFCRVLTWGWLESFMSTPPQEIRADLAQYDIVIGIGWAAAFADLIGRPLDLFISSGGDIFEDTLFQLLPHVSGSRWSPRQLRYHLGYFRFVRAQRHGLAAAKSILSANPRSRAMVRSFGFGGPFTDFMIPVVYTKLFCPENLPRMQGALDDFARRFPTIHTPYDLMKQARSRHSPLIFHHSRHFWRCSPENFSCKGNERLLKGFARFVKAHPALSPCLVMLGYGPDVSASKDLVAQLGLSESVLWLPLMPRRDIMAFLGMADLVASEFQHSWILSGVVMEALAMAKPVMAYRDDDAHRGIFPELYPIIPARSEEEIAAALADFVARPEHYAELGEQGRRWQDRYLIEDCIDKMLASLGLPAPGDKELGG